MKCMNTNELKEVLREGVARVTFTKADGSERVMEATLNPDLIPAEKHPSNEGSESTRSRIATKESRGLVSAFDVEARDWRTINTNTFSSLEPSARFWKARSE
jgi:hypothetical protein